MYTVHYDSPASEIISSHHTLEKALISAVGSVRALGLVGGTRVVKESLATGKPVAILAKVAADGEVALSRRAAEMLWL